MADNCDEPGLGEPITVKEAVRKMKRNRTPPMAHDEIETDGVGPSAGHRIGVLGDRSTLSVVYRIRPSQHKRRKAMRFTGPPALSITCTWRVILRNTH